MPVRTLSTGLQGCNYNGEANALELYPASSLLSVAVHWLFFVVTGIVISKNFAFTISLLVASKKHHCKKHTKSVKFHEMGSS